MSSTAATADAFAASATMELDLPDQPSSSDPHNTIGNTTNMQKNLQGSWTTTTEQKIVVGENDGTTATADPLAKNKANNNNCSSNNNKPSRITFEDHYSLGLTPSSTVTFRGRRVHVYEAHDEQFLLEENNDNETTTAVACENDNNNNNNKSSNNTTTTTTKITVKRFSSSSFGQSFLRLTYTLVSLLLTGFVFVFCFQIVLSVVMNLPAEAGATEGTELRPAQLMGAFLSIPIFLFGMASWLAMATTFTTDIWQGGPLVRSLTGWSIVVQEWMTFVVFLGVPAIAAMSLCFAKRNNWWEYTAQVWIVCVFAVLVVFSVGVVWREVTTCWSLVADELKKEKRQELLQDDENDNGNNNKNNNNNSNNNNNNNNATEISVPWSEIAHRAFLMTQSYRYSGRRNLRFLVSGTDEAIASSTNANPAFYSFSNSSQIAPVKSTTSLYSRLTLLPWCCCGHLFDRIDPPERLFTPEEIRDVEPFLTRQNWSLEKMCCRDSYQGHIMSARGPAALQPNQAWSSFACSILGSVLVGLLMIALLVWLDLGATAIALIAVLMFACCLYPMMRDSRSLHQTYKSIYSDDLVEDTSEEPDGHIFQVWETVCITKPRPALCYALFVIEVTLFFFWPLGSMYRNNSVSLASIFLVVALFSFFRLYFDASAILSRTGMVELTQANYDKEPDEIVKHRAQASISEIIGKISKSRTVGRWIWVLSVIAILIYIMFLSVVNSDSDVSPSDRPEILLLPDFYYPGRETLAYPTCELTKGFRLPEDSGTVQLLDFAFLSALAYEEPRITESLLATWFGPDQIVDEADFVADYRNATGTSLIPVWFKLFTFPDFPGVGVVSIRGSETTVDWLVNMQLWAATGIAQVVKHFIPFGWIWTPVLDDLLRVVSVVQSESLKKVSYYKTVAQFCRDLLSGSAGDNKQFNELRLTGASLGGGTAIIAGAQAEVFTVAISGPGAVLGRHTFDPAVSVEKLNQYTFNVIPDRDYVARLGGRSRLFQEIDCTAPNSNLFGCHSMWRTVCELAVSCGTAGRPALCMCVERFGYPEPIPFDNATQTFKEACGL